MKADLVVMSDGSVVRMQGEGRPEFSAMAYPDPNSQPLGMAFISYQAERVTRRTFAAQRSNTAEPRWFEFYAAAQMSDVNALACIFEGRHK